MQPNHSFHQVVLRNTPYLCILHDDKEVQIINFITAVEINVHNFHLHLTRGQTNKTAHKETNTMAHAYEEFKYKKKRYINFYKFEIFAIKAAEKQRK